MIPLHFDRKPARDDEGDEKRTLGQQLGVAAELASYAGPPTKTRLQLRRLAL